jgi:beta-galactosidase
MPLRRFPDGFLWGTSTSSFQVEMGRGEPASASDWWKWVHDEDNIRRGNASGAFPEQGPGFWELYREDLQRAKEELGNNAVRLSVDWARVFPRPTFDTAVRIELDENGDVMGVEVDDAAIRSLKTSADLDAVARYREIFATAGRLGLTVFLTLYHWPIPLWLHDPLTSRDKLVEATGTGWLDQKTIVEYAKYAAFAAYTFGDLVDIYATINEAPIICKYGYLHDKVHFPPGLNDVDLFITAFKNLAIAHNIGYEQVKKWDTTSATNQGPTSVGVVTVLEQYDPHNPNDDADIKAAEFNRYLWNEWNLNAVIRGDYDLNLDGIIDPEEQRPHQAKGCDFIGVDYYLRETVKHRLKGGDPRFNYEFTPSSRKTSDTGWEIHPEGLRNVLDWVFRSYRRPLYVTENGVADADDKLRVEYLTAHVEQVYKAIEGGTPVRGYFYWSLIDNYSWFSGYRSKFGLFSVDLKTKERHPTRGAAVYKNMATRNSLPE